MTVTTTAAKPTSRPHTDDEIDAAILEIVTTLETRDNDLVRWSRVRARLPKGCGFWQAHEAQHRLWRRSDLVVVQIGGTPWVGLADECTRLADAAAARRGEPRRALIV